MWQRNLWILGLGLSVACLDVATAPAGHTPLAASQPLGEHLWVFHIAGGPYAAHIQLLAIGDGADAQGRRVFRPIPSRAWDGTPTNDLAGFQATADDSAGSSWTLHSRGGEVLRLAYAVAGDTAIGALTLADGTRYSAFGVRFDSAAVNVIAPPPRPIAHDSLPVVMIRLDDAFTTDRDFLGRLAARGLTAEIAVPTRLAGLPHHLTWTEVRLWRAGGMGIAAHSRYHLLSRAGTQHFIAEVVGGLADLQAQGLASNIFVQPGSWRDSINFDSPTKLRTWRGALLQTFATVSECYAYGHWLPRVNISPLGLGHVTISDGQNEAFIRSAWQGILRPNHAAVFLVHTYRLKRPNQLDWFLDMIAAAKAHDSVRVVASANELFFSSGGRSKGTPGSTGPAYRSRLRVNVAIQQ